jgi:hypothetical protein
MTPHEYCPLRPDFLRYAAFRSPVNDNNTTFPTGAESVTFVGRPFPLDEAPQHLARLRRWGLTFGELPNLAPRPLRSYATLPFTVFVDESPFPHHLGGRGARWAVCLLTFSCHHLQLTRAPKHIRGIYDTSYLSYLRSVLLLFPQFGLTAFVALHQDVWSRYAGGSGAPAWTLEHTGFDLYALEESGAAWLRGVRGGGHAEAERGLWPCGYQKLAAATMA